MEQQVVLYPAELSADVCGVKVTGSSPTELYVNVIEGILKRYPGIIGSKETHFTCDSSRAEKYTGTTRSVTINGKTLYIKTGFSTKDKWKGIEKTCQLVGVRFVVDDHVCNDKDATSSVLETKKLQMRCTNCSSELPSTAIYCLYCGAKVVNHTSVEPTKPIISNGMIIHFGKYPQENGAEPQDIRWRVLKIQNNKALVLSIDAIEAKPFDESYEDTISWCNCTLRTWLNHEFVNTAFSQQEKEMILEVPITFDEEIQNSTQDQIFLLSKEEVESYFPCINDRKAYVTPHALKNGADTDASEGFSGPWWLRTMGKYSSAVLIITSSGNFHNYLASLCGAAIRPALWLNIEKYEGMLKRGNTV